MCQKGEKSESKIQIYGSKCMKKRMRSKKKNNHHFFQQVAYGQLKISANFLGAKFFSPKKNFQALPQSKFLAMPMLAITMDG